MKIVIKDKYKLLKRIKMPRFDSNPKYCSQSEFGKRCSYLDIWDGYCNFFLKDLYFDKGLNLRCEDCLDCFEVKYEN